MSSRVTSEATFDIISPLYQDFRRFDFKNMFKNDKLKNVQKIIT